MVAAAAIVLTILSGCSQNSVRAVTSSDRGAVNSAVAKLTPPRGFIRDAHCSVAGSYCYESATLIPSPVVSNVQKLLHGFGVTTEQKDIDCLITDSPIKNRECDGLGWSAGIEFGFSIVSSRPAVGGPTSERTAIVLTASRIRSG